MKPTIILLSFLFAFLGSNVSGYYQPGYPPVYYNGHGHQTEALTSYDSDIGNRHGFGVFRDRRPHVSSNSVATNQNSGYGSNSQIIAGNGGAISNNVVHNDNGEFDPYVRSGVYANQNSGTGATGSVIAGDGSNVNNAATNNQLSPTINILYRKQFPELYDEESYGSVNPNYKSDTPVGRMIVDSGFNGNVGTVPVLYEQSTPSQGEQKSVATNKESRSDERLRSANAFYKKYPVLKRYEASLVSKVDKGYYHAVSGSTNYAVPTYQNPGLKCPCACNQGCYPLRPKAVGYNPCSRGQYHRYLQAGANKDYSNYGPLDVSGYVPIRDNRGRYHRLANSFVE